MKMYKTNDEFLTLLEQPFAHLFPFTTMNITF
jgi:hypothetical protein